MRAKKLVACALSAAMMLGLASMTGCGSAKKDYDLYIYNTKSEICLLYTSPSPRDCS